MTPPQGFNGGLARRLLRFRATTIVLLGALLLARAAAQTVIDATWVGVAGTGNTNVLTNWTGVTAVPSNGNGGFNYNWIVDGGSLTNSTATVSAAASIHDLSISFGDTLTIANAVVLTLVARSGTGTITNHGTLRLNSTFNNTDLLLSGGTFTFSGTGSVTLGNHNANRIRGLAGTEHLVNSLGHTLQGSGQIGADSLTISNAGLIVANQATALTIDPGATALTNTGTLRATNSATLVLQNGSFTNTAGLLEAESNSHVDLNAATITGGTLTSHGTGHFHSLNSSLLAGVTITAGSTIEIGNSHRLLLSGTIANSGTITPLSTFHNTDVVSSGNVTLNGGGFITMGNHPANRIVGAAATDVLTNENNIISGAGQIGADLMGLVNRGTIIANQSNALTINPSAANVVNRGTLRASDGGQLNITGGTFTNSESGTAGTIEALATSEVQFNAATVVGGNLRTTDDGLLRNTGTLTLDGVSFLSGASFTQNNDADTTLLGTITNAGTLALNSNFHNTDLIVSGGDVTLQGSGTISFSNHPANRIVGAVTTNRLINDGNTIQGAGQVGADLMGLVNRGTIQATYNGGNALTINLAGTNNANSGTLGAMTGATLIITGTTLANFEAATPGVIRANAGTVQIAGASTITGGNAEVLGAGEIQLSSSTLANVSLTNSTTGIIRTTGGTSVLDGVTFSNPVGGQVILNNDTKLQLNANGTYTNSGSVLINSTFHNTEVIVSGGNVTLSGGGTLTLGNHPANRVLGAAATDRLINDNHTIQGSGQLGLDLMGFTNRGTVIANQSNSLTINPSAAGAANRGTLRGHNGVLNLVDGVFTNSENSAPGTIEARQDGRVDLNGATIIGGNFSTSDNGVIRNIGTTTLDNVTLLAGAKFAATNDADTTLIGTITNGGDISLNSTFHNTDLIVSGNVTLAGGGTVTLSNHPANRLTGATTNTLINQDNTIQGAGQIGADLVGLINRHVIVATETNSLTINPSAAGVVNRGTLRANGGVLNLVDGTFTNFETGVQGVIEALDASHVDLNGAVINGGFLSTGGTGSIRNIGTATLQNVSLTAGAKFSANNDADTTLIGTLTNAGTLTLNSSFHNTDLIVSGGDVTLTGHGTVSFSNHPANRVVAANPAHRLINENNTIQGAGQIGADLGGLVNRHLIVATQTNALTIDPSIAGVVNRGTLRADGGVLNLFNGVFTNSEDGITGRIEAFADSRVDLSAATIVGGTLASTGTGSIRNIGAARLENITVAAGSLFSANNDADTTLVGTITNSGTIALNSSFHNTDLIVSDGDVTLLGGGTLSFSNHPANRITAASPTLRLINENNTIQGAGQIGASLAGFVNRGLVIANQTNALTIAPSAAGVVNRGTLRADGAVLNLSSGTFTNSEGGFPGLIEAINAGHVDLNGATVIGGNLASTTGASFRNIGTATLQGVTLTSGTTFAANNATITTLAGTINNSGTLSLNSSFHNTDLVISGAVELTGGGVVAMGNHPANRITGAGTLTNSVGHTIRGSGALGNNEVTLVNFGTIEANQSNALTVNLASPLTNQGTLRATAGGNLVFVDALTNTSAIFVNAGSTLTAQSTFTQTAGFVALNGGTFSAASSTLGQSTGLFGAGTVSGAVTTSGSIAPGANGNGPGVGQITFNHALTLQPNSVLHFELGGAAAGAFDTIQAPTAALNGSLLIGFTGGFEASVLAGHTFTILTTTNATGLSGTFAGLPNGGRLTTLDGLASFVVTYNANSLVLSSFVAVPEPSTYLLLGVGAAWVVAMARRRRRT